MDAEWVADRPGHGHYAGSVAQLALTLVAAIGGVWAAVSFSDRREPAPERAIRPSPSAPAPRTHEVVVSGFTPESAYFFIVGSEDERAALASSLEAETAVRSAVGQPARVSWVAIAASDEEAEAIEDSVNQDGADRILGAVAPIEVIDLR